MRIKLWIAEESFMYFRFLFKNVKTLEKDPRIYRRLIECKKIQEREN